MSNGGSVLSRGFRGCAFGYPLKMCVERMELLLALDDLLPRPYIEVEHHAVEVDIIRERASGLQAVEMCLHRTVQRFKEFRILPGKVKVQIGSGITI
jgi:hypothetical protein